MWFEQVPFGSMQSLHELFLFLREFNIYFASIVFIGCLFRMVRIHLYWRSLSKENELYRGVNIEKITAWVALSTFNIGAALSSFSHKVYNSGTGIFIPITTLSILITLLAIVFARKEAGLKYIKVRRGDNDSSAQRHRKPKRLK